MQKVFIIGGGPAGYACAVRAARLGLSVTLAERGPVGGTCVNWGCTPSKAMIYSAKLYRYALHASKYGVECTATVNFDGVVNNRDAVVLAARGDMERVMHEAGVCVVRGEARVSGQGTVELRGTGNQPPQTYTADHIVFASGSTPRPPTFEAEEGSYFNSNELVSIKTLPSRLTIIGGGIIGVEFATIFSNLGTKVTLIEYEDRLMSWLSPSLSTFLRERLEADGVDVHTSCLTESLKKGELRVRNRIDDTEVTMQTESCMIALGRLPVFDESSCEAAGIAFGARGIGIDEYLRTNVPGVWAIGDVTGRSALAHAGIHQGIVCAENIAAGASGSAIKKMDYSLVPSVIYSLPEIACVGTVPAPSDRATKISVPFSKNLRAIIEGHTSGFAEAWFEDGKLKAVQIIGDFASEAIQPFIAIIAGDCSPETVARTVYPHPTYGELCQEVCAAYCGTSIG